jgi:hypothetical protein
VPVSTRTDVVDTSKGTVHMVLGGGGTSVPSNPLFFNPPQCRVITAVGDPGPVTGKRAPVYVTENAPWSAVRDAAHSYGFAAFTVDPGTQRAGVTSLNVTNYESSAPMAGFNPSKRSPSSASSRTPATTDNPPLGIPPWHFSTRVPGGTADASNSAPVTGVCTVAS